MEKSVAVFMGKLVMVLLCVIIVLPMVLMPADALAQKTVYVLGASDFQADTDAQSANIVKSILDRVVAAKYTGFDGFLFCGDYSAKWSYDTSLSGLNALKAAVTGKVGSIPNQFFVEGNHDNYNVPGITKTGGYETDYYDVYVLSESDFGWAGETSANAVAALANNLERWLAERTVGEKPVFVLTHIPLHYSTRTREIFDGQFNKYIVDVLNAAGQRGLNIVVLYGHNHGGYYDHYLGGSTNYIAKGDTLWVGDPSDVMRPPIGYTLNFTYMNAGFTGYYSGVDCAQCKAGNPIDGDFTMSVFEITGDQVVVRRFDKDGEHAVKEKAGHFYYQDLESTYGYTCHTKTYASPQTIPGASMELTAHAALGSERFQVGSSVFVAVKNPTVAAYTWTSSNPQAVSVQPGANGTAVVTGAQPGSAMITVSAGDDSQTAAFYVTVSDPENDTGAVIDDRGEYFYRLTDTMYNSKTYVIASHNQPGLTNVMTAPDTGYGLKNTADTRIHAYPEGTPFILSTTAKTRWRYWLTDETNNAGALYSEAWANPWWYIVMGSDDATLWMHDDVAVGDKLHTLTLKLKSAEWKWDRCLYSNVKSDSGKTLWLGYSRKQGCWWIRDDDQWNDEKLDDGTVSWLNTYIYEQTHNVASAKLSNMRGIWDGTSVGTYIVKTWTTGQMQYIPVTLDMLTDRNGNAVDLTAGGTLTGLTVTYNGVDITHDYSLSMDEIFVKFSGKHYYRLVDRFTSGTEGHYLIVSENTAADDTFAMQSAGIDMAVETQPVQIGADASGLPGISASQVTNDMVWRYTNWANADGTGGYYYYWLEQLVDADGETAHNFLEFTDSTCSKFKTTTAWTNPGYNPGVRTSVNSQPGLQTVYVKAGSPTGENRHIMFDGNAFYAVTDGCRVWGQEAYLYEKTEMTSALFRTLMGTAGEVAVNSPETAETGTYIQLLLPDGTLYSVSVTVDMLYKDGVQLTAEALKSPGTLSGLTLQYGGAVLSTAYELQVSGGIEIFSASLSFEDQILMNLYYSADFEAEEMGLLTWPAQPEQVSIDSAQTVFPGSLYDGENHRYMVKTDGIPAKKLGDDQYMAVYARLSDGSYVYSRVISYSPKRYALSRLEKSTDENLKALCAAMLNYGAAAQEYFGYRTDEMMNSDLTAEQKALVVPYSADLFAGGGAVDASKAGDFAATDGFSKKSATVSFEGAFAINYYFTPNETVDGTVTFYYWTAEDYAAAETLTADNATGSAAMVPGDGGAYWAEISGIAAKHMDAAYYVAAVYTCQGRQCSSGVIAYAVSTYCVKNSGGAMGELAQTTAVYGYHAKRYFGLG